MDISIIISSIALIISFISFYYLHIQGPKFRFDMNNHNIKNEEDILKTNNFEINYNIAIINDGNTTGIIKDIRLEIDPKLENNRGNIRIKKATSDNVGIYERDLYISLPKAVLPKESLILDIEFQVFLVKEKRSLQEWPDSIKYNLVIDVVETEIISVKKHSRTADKRTLKLK